MSVSVSMKSSKFPVGTVVKAFLPTSNRHFAGRPSGTASTEATVGADSKLTLTLDGESVYALWAEVGGTNANVQLGSIDFVDPGNLFTRLAAKRSEVGA